MWRAARRNRPEFERRRSSASGHSVCRRRRALDVNAVLQVCIIGVGWRQRFGHSVLSSIAARACTSHARSHLDLQTHRDSIAALPVSRNNLGRRPHRGNVAQRSIAKASRPVTVDWRVARPLRGRAGCYFNVAPAPASGETARRSRTRRAARSRCRRQARPAFFEDRNPRQRTFVAALDRQR